MPISATYNITNTDGTLSFAINVGGSNGPLETNPQTDLTLYGYGRTSWGQEVDHNFYKLVENFACRQFQPAPNATPSTRAQLGGAYGINKPVYGQSWFNLTTSEMYVCSDPTANTWKHLVSEPYADAKYMTTVAALGTGSTALIKLDGSNTPTTGYITLNANPVSSMHASTKSYVDTTVASGVGNKVNRTGDTMTGNLVITVPTANESFIVLCNEGSGNLYPEIQMGRRNGIATQAAFEFWTSGSATAIDSLIVAAGGTPGVSYQGAITLYGYAMSDGRVPTLANQFVTRQWVVDSIAASSGSVSSASSTAYVKKIGDTMSGALNMGTSKVINVGAPTTSTDVATKGYVDSQAYSPFGSSTSHSIRVSSAAPSGGADGDIWIRI